MKDESNGGFFRGRRRGRRRRAGRVKGGRLLTASSLSWLFGEWFFFLFFRVSNDAFTDGARNTNNQKCTLLFSLNFSISTLDIVLTIEIRSPVSVTITVQGVPPLDHLSVVQGLCPCPLEST